MVSTPTSAARASRPIVRDSGRGDDLTVKMSFTLGLGTEFKLLHRRCQHHSEKTLEQSKRNVIASDAHGLGKSHPTHDHVSADASCCSSHSVSGHTEKKESTATASSHAVCGCADRSALAARVSSQST